MALCGIGVAAVSHLGMPSFRTGPPQQRSALFLAEKVGRAACGFPGDDCSKSKCCGNLAHKCYSKHDYWATCFETCKEGKHPGTNFDDEYWSCKELSSSSRELQLTTTPLGDTNRSEEASSAQCKDAEPGEVCYTSVDWAMKHGIWEHPEWYPGLNALSESWEFQKHIYMAGQKECTQPPCTAGASKANHSKDDKKSTTTDDAAVEKEDAQENAQDPEPAEATTTLMTQLP